MLSRNGSRHKWQIPLEIHGAQNQKFNQMVTMIQRIAKLAYLKADALMTKQQFRV
jgi:hypothetical protein